MTIKMNRKEIARLKEITSHISLIIDQVTESADGSKWFFEQWKTIQTETKIKQLPKVIF